MSIRGKCQANSRKFQTSSAAWLSNARQAAEHELRRFASEESGSYAVILALVMPVLVGTAGLGTEVGWWLYLHKNMQSAADSGAVSAATAGSNLQVEANAVTAAYGYTNGANNVTVTVNQPPSTGSYATVAQAVEVIVSQQRPRLLSALFGSNPITITARSVAVPNNGQGCVLALDPTYSPAAKASGNANINLIGCNLYDNSGGGPALDVTGTTSVSANMVGVVGSISGASNITAANGIRTGMRPVADPYADFTPPSCTSYVSGKITINSSGKSKSLTPGTCYAGGVSVQAGYELNLDPGVYYFYGSKGDLSVQGNATITGTGVTLIFTGSTADGWASGGIGSNATVNLTAPTSGSTKAIVMYADRRMPTRQTTFNLTGGATQYFGGAIYLPTQDLNFAGGTSSTTSCTQIIADTVTLSGSSNLTVNCSSFGTTAIGVQTAQLVE
ncbi:TadE/TadG family type IV pilus assembly protein [Bradyrhizobium liaoningense]|uniref:TadE/TadG family type IV pilus assembly protein n=1 Tax=Bradyrhizobium liaoningense TaxID=43992 RepID=UPI001BAB4DA6|nr:pilus assembly protein TadG-related protein [Bradyrhizobium liaoningense]MBR0712823.1 hypothetical protein [Bradyrhizobium liaoningense]